MVDSSIASLKKMLTEVFAFTPTAPFDGKVEAITGGVTSGPVFILNTTSTQ